MKNCFLIVFALLFSACSFLNRGEKPEISIVDVKFSEMSVFETSANFTVRIQNSNPFEMNYEGAKYNIYLNDINVGKGLVDNSFTVPKLGSITQDITIRLSNLSLIRNIQKLVDANQFEYKIESVLYKSGSLGLASVDITETGSFNTKY